MKPLNREALLGAFPRGAAIPRALEQLYDYAHGAHPDMQEWTNAWVRRGRRT